MVSWGDDASCITTSVLVELPLESVDFVSVLGVVGAVSISIGTGLDL